MFESVGFLRNLGALVSSVGAVFTLVNVLLRIVNTYHLGETMNTYTWLGVVALIISIVLFKM